MNLIPKNSSKRLFRDMISLALAAIIFTSVSGCMLLAAGAAGAGAGYVASEANDDDE